MFASAQGVGGKQTLNLSGEWIKTGYCRTGTKYCTRCVLVIGQGFERFCRECLGCAGLRGGANIAGGSPP